MKHLAIVKHHPCAQLAHLYEHLFFTAVADYLYRHGQYKLSGLRALNGATYDSGVISAGGSKSNIKLPLYIYNLTRLALYDASNHHALQKHPQNQQDHLPLSEYAQLRARWA